MNFFKCTECCSIAMEIVSGEHEGAKVFQELLANTMDASGEKHVPLVEKKEGSILVKVGELEHPMLEEHHIMWIYLETEHGGMLRKLNPGDKPEAEFCISPEDKPVAAYEYCNLHGLWKAEIK